MRGVPDKRIEPINAANNLNQNLKQSIIALHVRELMSQDQATALVSPVRGG